LISSKTDILFTVKSFLGLAMEKNQQQPAKRVKSRIAMDKWLKEYWLHGDDISPRTGIEAGAKLENVLVCGLNFLLVAGWRS